MKGHELRKLTTEASYDVQEARSLAELEEPEFMPTNMPLEDLLSVHVSKLSHLPFYSPLIRHSQDLTHAQRSIVTRVLNEYLNHEVILPDLLNLFGDAQHNMPQTEEIIQGFAQKVDNNEQFETAVRFASWLSETLNEQDIHHLLFDGVPINDLPNALIRNIKLYPWNYHKHQKRITQRLAKIQERVQYRMSVDKPLKEGIDAVDAFLLTTFIKDASHSFNNMILAGIGPSSRCVNEVLTTNPTILERLEQTGTSKEKILRDRKADASPKPIGAIAKFKNWLNE